MYLSALHVNVHVPCLPSLSNHANSAFVELIDLINTPTNGRPLSPGPNTVSPALLSSIHGRTDPRCCDKNPDAQERLRGFTRGRDENRLFRSGFYQQHILRCRSWHNVSLSNFLSFSPKRPKILGGYAASKTPTRPHADRDPTSVANIAQLSTVARYVTKEDTFSAFTGSRRSRWTSLSASPSSKGAGSGILMS